MPDTDSHPRLEISLTIKDDSDDPVSLLAARSGLSKGRIKDAMNKGAVTLRHGAKLRRLRRVRSRLVAGDQLELHYDGELLARKALVATCLLRGRQFSIWFKPPGMLSQGTAFGDHCALLRQVEQQHSNGWLIHRLDREAFGLIVLAHDRRAAAELSAQFATRGVDKRYRVVVCGTPDHASINQPLDGRAAVSRIKVLKAGDGNSLVEVTIDTGRKHQIRRHLEHAGCPVLGDPRYGRGNHHPDGLHLCAWKLGFRDPHDHATISLELPADLRPAWFDHLV